jgi:membrane fusion protein, multidrug efflux system
VVTIRDVDIGDLIVAGSGGKQLFHIAQADKLRVYVRVPEPYTGGIVTGEVATLTTPENPGQTFTGIVTTTSEAISPVSRTLLTELEVNNPKNEILPYSFGEIALRGNSTHPLLTLPSNAILFRAQGLQVGVVLPDDTVELRSVQIGRDFGQTIEILGGVSRTDRVIVNPPDSLVSAIKVRVQTATAAGAGPKN